jgi:uncharacterized protein
MPKTDPSLSAQPAAFPGWLPAALIAGGLVVAAALLTWGLSFVRPQPETLRVVGSATRSLKADVLKWRVTLMRTAPSAGAVAEAGAQVGRDTDAFLRYLDAGGIPRAAVTVQATTTEPRYGPQGPSGYQVVQNLFVISQELDRLEKLAVRPDPLLAQGLLLQTSRLEYYFSNLADIKRQLLADATRDARQRAEEVARNAGVKIGRLISARTGVFQITEPYSTEISDYGVYSNSTRDKDVTVTLNATYTLR